jgi:hypothetical protein
MARAKTQYTTLTKRPSHTSCTHRAPQKHKHTSTKDVKITGPLGLESASARMHPCRDQSNESRQYAYRDTLHIELIVLDSSQLVTFYRRVVLLMYDLLTEHSCNSSHWAKEIILCTMRMVVYLSQDCSSKRKGHPLSSPKISLHSARAGLTTISGLQSILII